MTHDHIVILDSHLVRLDIVLDNFFLNAAQFLAGPPNRLIVVAFHMQVNARLASGTTFIAFFPSETAGKTS